MKTIDRRPSSVAASATPWAWLPADAATIGSPSSGSEAMWWCAPRILNEPVRCRYSVLNRTVRPQMAEMLPLGSTGVSRSTPTRPARARRISSIPTNSLSGATRSRVPA